MSQLFWLLWLLSLVWISWVVLNWRRDWFVATDKRFLMFYGFLHRRVDMMPLVKVTDLSFNRSLVGRLLGYGDFTLESAGQHQALSHIAFIPHADEHYRRICQVLFGQQDGDDASALPDGPDGSWGPDDRWGEDQSGGGPSSGYPHGGGGGSPGDTSGGHSGVTGGGRPGSPDGRGSADPYGGPRDTVEAPNDPTGAPYDPTRTPNDPSGQHATGPRTLDPADLRAFGLPVSEASLRQSRSRRPGSHTDQATPGDAIVYRSSDGLRDSRRADTDEIPLRAALPMPPPPRRAQRRRPRGGSPRPPREESQARERPLYPPTS